MKKSIFLALPLLFAVGCSDSDDDGTNPPVATDFELAGEWDTEAGGFAGTATITNTSWKDYLTVKVVSFDNAKNVAITQNPPDSVDPVKPNLFLKTVWTEPSGGVTYVCVVDYDLATEAEALASTKSADANDTAKGCAGYPWTKFTRRP